MNNSDQSSLFKIISLLIRSDTNLFNSEIEKIIYDKIPSDKKIELSKFCDKLQNLSDEEISQLIKYTALSIDEDIKLMRALAVDVLDQNNKICR